MEEELKMDEIKEKSSLFIEDIRKCSQNIENS